MENKNELFLYFVKKLLEKYQKLDSSEKNSINRYHVLKMLFLAVIYNEDLLSEFDNFYAMSNWPVESDCYNYIYDSKDKFEYFIYNKLNQYTFQLEQSKKDLIEKSIKSLPDNFFKKDYQYLIDYTHKFKSWKESWNVALEYWIKSYKMSKIQIWNETISMNKILEKIKNINYE